MKKFNKILLVEDEQIDAFLSKTVFNYLDIAEEIIVCKDGEEALQMLKTIYEENSRTAGQPELILLDINMPGMNGIEFLQEIRQSYHYNFTVIILSSSENPRDISQAAKYNASYYLVKPITEEKIKKMIERVFPESGP